MKLHVDIRGDKLELAVQGETLEEHGGIQDIVAAGFGNLVDGVLRFEIHR